MAHTPIEVVVSKTRYDSYGDPLNWWHVFLEKTLAGMGGINEGVEPGVYEFNVHFKGLRMIASLQPKK